MLIVTKVVSINFGRPYQIRDEIICLKQQQCFKFVNSILDVIEEEDFIKVIAE